jgi:hypothetical protein
MTLLGPGASHVKWAACTAGITGTGKMIIRPHRRKTPPRLKKPQAASGLPTPIIMCRELKANIAGQRYDQLEVIVLLAAASAASESAVANTGTPRLLM